jgi:hypothetical protein
MILQTDKRFKNKFIPKDGCATMCVFFIVNKLTNYPFSPKEIDKLVKIFKKKGIYTKDMDIYWQKAFSYFGIKTSYKKTDATYFSEDNEYEITAYYNKRTKYTHFVVTKGEVVVYDPIGLSVTVAEGYQESKRIIGII